MQEWDRRVEEVKGFGEEGERAGMDATVVEGSGRS